MFFPVLPEIRGVSRYELPGASLLREGGGGPVGVEPSTSADAEWAVWIEVATGGSGGRLNAEMRQGG
jgi:hypothetical protein